MNIKRILIFALALMVMAMPASLAEAAYGALTLSNFHVEATGMEAPLDIDATLKIGAGGQKDGSGRMDIEVTGGGQTAFSGSAGFSADTVQAIIGGTSYYFEIPMEDLQKLGEESMSAAVDSSEQLSAAQVEQIKAMAESYAKFLEKASNPEAAMKMSVAVLGALNPEAKGKETVDLFGEPTELNRFDITMNAADVGKLYDVLLEDADFKAFFVGYMDMIAQASGEEIPLDPDDMAGSIEKLLSEAEVDMTIDFSIWTDVEALSDEEAKAMKMSAAISVTNLDVKEGETPETVVIPYDVAVLESDAGTQVSVAMHVEAPDEEGALSFTFAGTFDAPSDGGTTSSATLAMTFDGEDDSEDFIANATFDAATGADGVTDFSFGLNGVGGGETFAMSFKYDGQTATDTEKAGTVAIDFNAPASGMTVSFTCDTLVETGAFAPLGDADFEGRTKINPITATEEEMTAIETELQGVMFQAMGVLMQTPGLSNIVGGAMNAGAIG